MRNEMRAFVLLALGLVLGLARAAAVPPPGILGPVSLGPFVEVLEDPARALSFDDVRRGANAQRFAVMFSGAIVVSHNFSVMSQILNG